MKLLLAIATSLLVAAAGSSQHHIHPNAAEAAKDGGVDALEDYDGIVETFKEGNGGEEVMADEGNLRGSKPKALTTAAKHGLNFIQNILFESNPATHTTLHELGGEFEDKSTIIGKEGPAEKEEEPPAPAPAPAHGREMVMGREPSYGSGSSTCDSCPNTVSCNTCETLAEHCSWYPPACPPPTIVMYCPTDETKSICEDVTDSHCSACCPQPRCEPYTRLCPACAPGSEKCPEPIVCPESPSSGPTTSPDEGDFIQIAHWRLARVCEECLNDPIAAATGMSAATGRHYFSIGSNTTNQPYRTSMIFRGDGMASSPLNQLPLIPRSDYNGWDVGARTGPTFSKDGVKFGDRVVQVRDWRIRQIDADLSVTHESGNVAQIYRSDGTRDGNDNLFSGYTIPELGEPTCAYLASNYLQIGDWRFGAVDTAHFSVSHKDGKTAAIHRIDGTVHPGPRTNYSAWDLDEEPAIMGSNNGCIPMIGQVHKVRVQLQGTNYLQLAEVQVFDDAGANRALKKQALQSSTGYGAEASLAVNDILTDTTHTGEGEDKYQPWWEVDMRENVPVTRVKIYNRVCSSMCMERLSNSIVSLLDKDDNVLATYHIVDASDLIEIEISASDFTLTAPTYALPKLR